MTQIRHDYSDYDLIIPYMMVVLLLAALTIWSWTA